MRRGIQEQQCVFDNGAEDKARDERHIGDGANVPSARCAIMMVAERAVVLVMVDNAEHKRDAQIQQTHHDSRYARLGHADAEFGVSRCESQARLAIDIPCFGTLAQAGERGVVSPCGQHRAWIDRGPHRVLRISPTRRQ